MSEDSIAGLIVLLTSFFLVLSIISYEIKRYLKIPTALTLIVWGILFQITAPYLGQLSNVLLMILSLETSVVNYVFLPILIFEACFSSDWYTIRKELWQILLLSTTVPVSSAVLTSVILQNVFGYDLEFQQLITFGFVLSLTDHINVKTLMKEIRSSEKLETLIIGETMFNLATVLVFFEASMIQTTGMTGFKDALVIICRLTFGGAATGIGFSFIYTIVIRRMLNDIILETNITLASVYLLYWVCLLSSLSFSAPLALVLFGVFMSVYGKTLISSSVAEELRETFMILARNSESILLIFGGIFFANLTLSKGTLLTTKDYYSLFLLFPATYVIRGVVLLIHYPVLKRIGYKIHLRELFFLCLSGVKGVISVSLASLASRNPSFDAHTSYLVLYFGIGVAVLSIAFGGLASKLWARYMGLERLSNVEENILIAATCALIENTKDSIEMMKNDEDYWLADWKGVAITTGCQDLLQKIVNKTYGVKKNIKRAPANLSQRSFMFFCHSRFTISNEQLAVEIRKRFLSTLKGMYWKRFKNGLCTGLTAVLLIDSTNYCLDRENQVMADWAEVRRSVYRKGYIRALGKLSELKIVGKVVRDLLYKKIILAYSSAMSFIRCHEDTEKVVMEIKINYNPKVFKKVMKESHKQIEKCKKFMNLFIFDSYPEVITNVQTKYAEHILLKNQRKIVQEIYHGGLIKDLEYETLKSIIESSIKKSTFESSFSLMSLKDILRNRFKQASDPEIEDLSSQIRMIEAAPDEKLFKEGEKCDGAFLIIRGRVKEFSSWVDEELVIGNIVGVQYLLEEYSERYMSTAVVVSNAVIAHIPQKSLMYDGFCEDLYKEAVEEILLLNRERYQLLPVGFTMIFEVISKSSVVYYKRSAVKQLKSGALVLSAKPSTAKQPWILKPRKKKRCIEENTALLVLPYNFEYFYDNDMGQAFIKYCNRDSEDLFSEEFKAFNRRLTQTIVGDVDWKEESEKSSIDL